MRISVIVPIFNVEEYLETCILSIINQTYKDIEIILVNDGSYDASKSICESFLKKDKRIKLINTTNGGVSKARNLGIDYASGDYIMFVDGDDFIKKNAIYDINYVLESKIDIDILLGQAIEYYNEDFEIAEDLEFDLNRVIDKPGIEVFSYLLDSFSIPMWSIWRIVIKTKLIKDNNIRFYNNVTCAEDLEFSLSVYKNADKIAIYDIPYYFYRKIRNGSVMNTISLQKNMDEIFIINKISKELKGSNYDISFYNAIYKWMAQIVINQVKSLIEFKEQEQKNIINEINKISFVMGYSVGLNNQIFKLLIKLFGYRKTSKIYNLIKLLNFQR